MSVENTVDEYTFLELNLKEVFGEIISEYELPENTFTYERSYSDKEGQEDKIISCGIYINEMTYPPVKSDTVLTSYLVVRHQELKKGKLEFKIRNDQFCAIELPETAIIKNVSDKTYKHVLFDPEDKSLIGYLEKNIRFCLKNYKPSCVFGCCSSFKECSDAKKCLHPNFLYAKGCQYRQNLEAGKIFY